jgi:hypothetical protein
MEYNDNIPYASPSSLERDALENGAFGRLDKFHFDFIRIASTGGLFLLLIW